MLARIKIGSIFCLVAVISFPPQSTMAQISPDGTTSTTVTTEGNVSTISDGDRAGSNLFHSFQDFSVPNGNQAFFNNAADVTNIFSRVTGGNISNIDGLIGANNANLFLINPAGIIFGNGASLNLGGGSFYGSTADSILFEDGEFGADLNNPPLLTINAPIGFSFRDNPAAIEVNGANLAVAPGQNLTLLGGDLNLTNSTRLFTPGANVELGAVSGSGIVELDENFRLDFPDNIALADILLNNDVAVNVTADGGGSITINAENVELSENSRLITGIGDNSGSVDVQAGDIVINAQNNLTLNGDSRIVSQVGNNAQGNAGEIQITTAANLVLDGNSTIIGQVLDNGQGETGNIQITTSSLTLNNTSSIVGQTFGSGNSGSVNINAEDTIAINSNSSLRSLVRDNSTGDAGDINLNTGVLIAETTDINPENRSLIFSNTFGAGNAGNININATDAVTFDNSSVLAQVDEGASGNGGNVTINTPLLEVKNSASEVPSASGIFTDTKSTGDAGDINITADDALTIDRRSSIGAGTTNTGNAGDINITTDLLSISNFALLATNVRENAGGEAGTIFIDANDVTLSAGGSIDTSIIDVSRPTDFTGGEINIEANTLNLLTGGKISSSSTNSSGNAGNLNLTIAESLTIDGSNPASLPPEFRDFLDPLLELESITGLLALTRLGATGNGGNINILSPDASINIANGEAQISVSSQGQGSGGSLLINAQELRLDNNGSIFASTPSGQGGLITLDIANSIILNNDSSITAQAFNDADGGNIDIDTDFIVAFPSAPNGSDITAGAESGNGGNINITAEEIFGLVEGTSTPGNGINDIDASSEFGFDGSVSLETPDISSFQGVVELSANVVEAGDSVAKVCEIDSGVASSSLAIKGREGIMPQPTEPLSSDYLLVEGTIASDSESTQAKIDQDLDDEAIVTGKGSIYPARGVIVKADGTFILTAVPERNKLTQRLNKAQNCLTNQ